MNTIDPQISTRHGVRDDFYAIVCVAAFALVCVFAVVPAQGERVQAPIAATLPPPPALLQSVEPATPSFAEITPAETVGAYEV